MKKIFKANDSTSDKRVLEVTDWTKPGVSLVVDNPGIWGHGIVIPPSDAPALALAILEAAGIEAVPFDEGWGTIPGHAVWALRHHVQASEAKAKEAADREARTKRQDRLAKELGASRTYTTYRQLSGTSQRAIDRIIELEDLATK